MKRIFWLALWLAVPTMGFAQSELSLADALRNSLDNNYAIRIGEKDAQLARLFDNPGEAGKYPTIQLLFNQNNTLTSVDNPASFLSSGEIINNNISPVVQVDWLLFGGFRVQAESQRLQRLREQSENQAQIVVENTLQAVLLGYFRVLLEQERQEVLGQVLALSRDRYDYLKLRQEVGSAELSDVLLEEGNYLTDSANFIQQTLAVRSAQRDLNALMAVDNPNERFIATGKLAVDPQQYQLEDLLDKLRDQNRSLQDQFLSNQVRMAALSLAQADLWPSLNAQFSLGHQRTRQDLSNAVFASGDNGNVNTAVQTNVALNFTISWTLFNGGRINRAISGARLDLKRAQLETGQLELSLARDLYNAHDQYEIRRQLLGIAQRNRAAAEENLSLGRERYQTGKINAFDYRIIQNNYLNAAFAELEARFNVIDSQVELIRLTGGLIDQYGQP